MSTKEWITDSTNGVGIYQECINDSDVDDVNPNPVVIQLNHSSDKTITQKVFNDKWANQFNFEVSIPAKTFDKIAINWCRKRSLNTNKYSLEELLSKCNFLQPYHADKSIEVLEEDLDDFALTQTVKERSEQPAIDADLDMDNIFNILASDPLEAKYMKECSNELIQLRELGQNLCRKYPILSKIGSEDEHAKALRVMEMLLEDYDNNLLLIGALSCSIARYETRDDTAK